MIWQTAKADDIGGRDDQQDRVEIFEAPGAEQVMLVLADGMGGHAGGEMAAQAVIDVVGEAWRRHLDEPVEAESFLGAIIAGVHERINQVGIEHGLTPRSTIVLLYLNAGKAHWAHVGDSRLYHFRDGVANARTHDHSVVQMLVDMGKVAEEEMADHPDQNRLTQSLGGDPEPKAEFGASDLAAGDGFVLCSDGLWENASEDEMARTASALSLLQATSDLAKLAAERGGKEGDNVALAIARIEDRPG